MWFIWYWSWSKSYFNASNKGVQMDWKSFCSFSCVSSDIHYKDDSGKVYESQENAQKVYLDSTGLG